ncbi:MAG: class I SAM-dependent methyltransferase [Bacteroidales bacterium]|nr:class I SAM-dependent methyltransferase [Bacteroidales bacterium]
METELEKYIREHSTAQGEALEWIEKQTNIRTNYPQMLSGAVQGRFLTMMVELTGARDILEIGTFTGYSAVCLANGLHGNGRVHTLEINDELEDLTREGWRKAGVEDLITLHIGDARDILETLPGPFDLVYIDANKREYTQYYNLVIDKMRPGALLLVDDVLLGGKVYEPEPACDKQTQGLLAFNDTIAKDPRVEVAILPIRDGLSVIRKKG